MTQTAPVCGSGTYSFSFWAMQDGEGGTTCDINACFDGQCIPIATIDDTSLSWQQYSVVVEGFYEDYVDIGIETDSCDFFVLYDDFAFVLQ